MMLGTKKQQVKAKGCTLRDLIGTLNDITLGKLEEEVLAPDGSLDAKFKIFVNGSASDNLPALLADGDDVLLFSVIDGG
jgi:hypothetical protein